MEVLLLQELVLQQLEPLETFTQPLAVILLYVLRERPPFWQERSAPGTPAQLRTCPAGSQKECQQVSVPMRSRGPVSTYLLAEHGKCTSGVAAKQSMCAGRL